MDLGEIKFIDTVKAWNRSDTCCNARTKDYYIFVSNTPFTSTTIAGTLAQSRVFSIRNTGEMGRPSIHTINRPGRYVRVQLVNADYLHLSEIQVIGDDPNLLMAVTKTADKKLNVAVGEEITYTYEVTNNSNVPLFNVNLSDVHNASGPVPVPGNEQRTDNAPTGDSVDDISNDGVWTELGPGDVVTMTGKYQVTQDDIDNLQ